LHPETIKQIGRLEIRARHVVEGFLAGMHRSPYFGQSVEFLQHREYVAGDELRHVDWKVWARQDRLYVKQFEEETNLRCLLLVDVSNSMSYGRGPMSKYEYACTAAACLAYLILRQHDAVGCVAFDEKVRKATPVRTKRTHLHSVIETLNVAVMGCIVNGPGESKHADIGISLPGTGEAPAAPVFIDGQKAMTLRGAGIAAEFKDIVQNYIEKRFGARSAAE